MGVDLFSMSAADKATESFKAAIIKNEHKEGSVKETEVEKAKRIETLLKPENIDDYIQYYFNPDNKENLYPLAYFHKELLKDIFEKDIRMHRLEWYRGAAKSKMVTLYIPTLLIARGLCKGIAMVSETADKSEILLNQICNFLANSKRFQEDFNIIGVEGKVESRRINMRTPTGINQIGIWGFGLQGNPAGIGVGFNRPNMIFCDDADKPAMSKTQVYKALDFIFNVLLGVTDIRDESYFFFANNRISPKGLTAHIAGDETMDGVVIPSGIKHSIVHLSEDPVTRERKYLSQGGVLSWGEGADVEAIKRKIDDMGGEFSEQVKRKYYNLANQGGRVFRGEYIVYDTLPDMTQMEQIISYCDNATPSEIGCSTAIITIGRKKNCYYLYDAYIDKPKSFANAHHKIYERYLPYAMHMGNKFQFYCEYRGLSASLYKEQYTKLHDEGITWEPRKDTRTNRGPKEERIANSVWVFAAGRVKFNSDKRHDIGMQRLVEEMSVFPEDKKQMDGLDAMEGALTILGLNQRNVRPIVMPRHLSSQNRRVGLLQW